MIEKIIYDGTVRYLTRWRVDYDSVSVSRVGDRLHVVVVTCGGALPTIHLPYYGAAAATPKSMQRISQLLKSELYLIRRTVPKRDL